MNKTFSITPFVKAFTDTFKEPAPQNPADCIGSATAQLTKTLVYGAWTYAAGSQAFTSGSLTAKVLWAIPTLCALVPTVRNAVKGIQNIRHIYHNVLDFS
ncbi:MAG: hypothetical protein PHD48_01980 [Alphaproteobacteria bacterium]|nr:hypothetical protein [Alphaproteobacteria bacterium]